MSLALLPPLFASLRPFVPPNWSLMVGRKQKEDRAGRQTSQTRVRIWWVLEKERSQGFGELGGNRLPKSVMMSYQSQLTFFKYTNIGNILALFLVIRLFFSAVWYTDPWEQESIGTRFCPPRTKTFIWILVYFVGGTACHVLRGETFVASLSTDRRQMLQLCF